MTDPVAALLRRALHALETAPVIDNGHENADADTITIEIGTCAGDSPESPPSAPAEEDKLVWITRRHGLVRDIRGWLAAIE